MANSPDLNPYASPQTNCREEPFFSPSEYSVIVSQRSWAYRRLLVSGPAPCVIEYNGRGLGYESVLVNGIEAAHVRSHAVAFAPRLPFVVPCAAGQQQACIEIKTTWLLFIGGLRLTIGDRVVFREGDW